MADVEVDSVFFGGKGKSKGKRRSTGKGQGRRKNPRGSDGEIMLCGICGSDEHFRAQRPRQQNSTSSSSGFGGLVAGPIGNIAMSLNQGGPLGDLRGPPPPPLQPPLMSACTPQYQYQQTICHNFQQAQVGTYRTSAEHPNH